MDRVSAPDTVRRLVETFDLNRDSCRSSADNETQLRRDFLDPFFESLGWDVDEVPVAIGTGDCGGVAPPILFFPRTKEAEWSP